MCALQSLMKDLDGTVLVRQLFSQVGTMAESGNHYTFLILVTSISCIHISIIFPHEYGTLNAFRIRKLSFYFIIKALQYFRI